MKYQRYLLNPWILIYRLYGKINRQSCVKLQKKLLKKKSWKMIENLENLECAKRFWYAKIGGVRKMKFRGCTKIRGAKIPNQNFQLYKHWDTKVLFDTIQKKFGPKFELPWNWVRISPPIIQSFKINSDGPKCFCAVYWGNLHNTII